MPSPTVRSTGSRGAAARRAPFHIVQLSDLHLTARDDASRTQPDLFGALTGMNAAFRRLLAAPAVAEADLIVVTGDVTDRGDLASWRVFWDALGAVGLAARCLVVPGNHDVCCLTMRVGAEHERRAADLQRVQAGLALGGQPTRFPWTRLTADGRIALFGLDSCNAGNATVVTNAVGVLGFPQLERLARRLRAHRDAPVKLILMHHSPNIPGRLTEERRGLPPTNALARWGHEVPLADRRALRLLCLTHGVAAVIHGHVHRSEDRRVNGVRMVGARPSTDPVGGDTGPAAELLRYVVADDGGRVAVERVRVPLA
jgi:3',5'-cyclic AMP phosphodiesterase CpdA